MHSLLLITTAISVAVSVLVFWYYAVLAIVALGSKRRRQISSDSAFNRFAVIIPAHNEESTISIALQSCMELDYSRSYFDVFVIADNCSDRTAEVAARNGARVITREISQLRGKGYALKYAFELLAKGNFDAFVVLDADCRLDTRTLQVANSCLVAGDEVIQCNNRIDNYDDSPTSLLMGIANALENDFFYAPKSRLGLFVPIRGTGMIFSKANAVQYPWNTTSHVEDTEHSLLLARNGIRVHFLEDVNVISSSPANRADLSIQRSRWFGRCFDCVFKVAPQLLWDGIKHRNFFLIDAAITAWVVGRPLVIAQLVVSLSLATLCFWLNSGVREGALAVGVISVSGGYFVYSIIGLIRIGITPRRVLMLFGSPIVVIHYLWITMRTVVLGAPIEWHARRREVSASRQ
jgi:1,2-diacylglycerol 3-beta-glucosyltransferase